MAEDINETHHRRCTVVELVVVDKGYIDERRLEIWIGIHYFDLVYTFYTYRITNGCVYILWYTRRTSGWFGCTLRLGQLREFKEHAVSNLTAFKALHPWK